MATSARKKRPSGKKKTPSRKKATPVKKGLKKQSVSISKKAVESKTQAKKLAKTPPRSGNSMRPVRPSTPMLNPSRVNVLTGPSRGFKPYQPKRGEEYMSTGQLDHFRQILLAWKRELMDEVDRTMHHMKDDAANFPDPNDRATQESEFGLELRTRDRERKLLKKIDSALTRIDERTYGYCEETGDEIGLRRLEARPVATLCVEAQERRELAERQFRDREDHYR
jgi:DnaK suppressor protein